MFKFMSKVTRVLPVLLFAFVLAPLFFSCTETEEVDEYDNWQARNEAFVDSIARVAIANADGRWMRIRSFNLMEKDAQGNVTDWENDSYIYCHSLNEGEGTVSPIFTDTVLVNYRGRLMPSATYPDGLVFDQSYKGTLDPRFNVPTKFCVGAVVAGFSTALQHMHTGDTWRVYIPASLGYGISAYTASTTKIPAYSTLVFDINLVSFTPVGIIVR